MSAEAVMPEKPLHVRVAEAIGCQPRHLDRAEWKSYPHWECTCPKIGSGGMDRWPHGSHNSRDNCWESDLAEYDTDWSATGPLIERLRNSNRLVHKPRR